MLNILKAYEPKHELEFLNIINNLQETFKKEIENIPTNVINMNYT